MSTKLLGSPTTHVSLPYLALAFKDSHYAYFHPGGGTGTPLSLQRIKLWVPDFMLVVSSLTGQSFLNAFTWQTITDPNNGRVNYIDEATAHSKGLVSVSGNQVTLRTDSTTTLDPTGPGRDTFRLMSNDQYTTHVAIFDIAHMPQGCATWPAVWFVRSRPFVLSIPTHLECEVGADWPNEGEIDIVEGVNNQNQNLITLHTSADCTMPPSRSMTG
ncbi:hypothetical protein BS17DRAFT_822536 [Gyrodon lividus]|nr:hypothetical protein BS17DRAFT_822536 [Gyrodon lividus]